MPRDSASIKLDLPQVFMTLSFSKISFRKMRKRISLKNSFASRIFNPLKQKALVSCCFVNFRDQIFYDFASTAVDGFMKIKFMAYFCSKIILHRVVAPVGTWN